MKWKKWLSMGLAAALVIGLSNLDMVQAAEGEEIKSATAYLYFTDGNWAQDVNYHKPGGDGQTKTTAQEVQITGDGTYHLALDFRGTNNQKTNNCSKVKICISDGDNIFGSHSIITIEKVVINGLSRDLPKEGFTSFDYNWNDGGTKDTIFYLYNQNADNEIGALLEGDRVQGAERTAIDLRPFPDFGITNIETLEVDFSFSVNGASNPSESPNPAISSNPSESPDPNITPDPNVTGSPNTTPDPNVTKNPNATPDPNATKKPNATSDPNASKIPDVTQNPDATQNPSQSGALVSNSTYTGAEKIMVQNDSVIIPAGGSSTVTFALLRSATSSTQVSVSSGDTGIASPALQEDGKVRITVPGTAAAGSSTIITLQFGSSSASVKVTVRNATSKVKAVKKSYNVKRNKKSKVVFQITAQNKSKATTDEPVVKLSGKKAAVSSVKLSGSKLTVTVKGVKKGSATLKATLGGKTAKTKLKIK